MNNPQQNNDNVNWQNAMNLVKYTHQSVFLTGKAGTGKSTFLKQVCQETKKKFVVLAPTGIAAINAEGSTLHSFFKLPFTLCCQMILTCHCNGAASMSSSNTASRTVSCWKNWNLSSSTRFLWCELTL